MDWLELHIDTSPIGIDAVTALLEQQGVEIIDIPHGAKYKKA